MWVEKMRGLEMTYQELIKAGDKLSFMAQTSGGVAGRDDDLVAAIQEWQQAKDKYLQLSRIRLVATDT